MRLSDCPGIVTHRSRGMDRIENWGKPGGKDASIMVSLRPCQVPSGGRSIPRIKTVVRTGVKNMSRTVITRTHQRQFFFLGECNGISIFSFEVIFGAREKTGRGVPEYACLTASICDGSNRSGRFDGFTFSFSSLFGTRSGIDRILPDAALPVTIFIRIN
jgi:hypothetical protein